MFLLDIGAIIKDYWWLLLVVIILIGIGARVITAIKNKGMNLEKRDKNPLPALLSIFICFLKALVRMVIGLVVVLMIYGGVNALLIKDPSLEGAEKWNLVVNSIFLGVAFVGLFLINLIKDDDKLVEMYGYRSLVYYIVFEFILFNLFVLIGAIFFSKEVREYSYQLIPELAKLEDFGLYLILLASLALFAGTSPFIIAMTKNSCFRCWTANAWSFIKRLDEGEYDSAVYETTGGKYERVGTETTTYEEVDECGTVYSSRQESRGVYEYKPRETKIVGYQRMKYYENYEGCRHCGKKRTTFHSYKK